MNYCRQGPNCDIDCFYNGNGYYEVWSGRGEDTFDTAQEVIDFLHKRREAGDKVPDDVFEELEKEKEYGCHNRRNT